MSKKKPELKKPLHPERLQKVMEEVEELQSIFNTTRADIQMVQDWGRKKPGYQFWRRLYARTIFSHIDGFCFCLKQIARHWHNQWDQTLSRAEVAIIHEESHSLTDNGRAKTRPLYQGSEKNLRFAIKIFTRVMELSFKLKTEEEGFRAYKKGIEIRNRITHPKKNDYLIITDKELKILDIALGWWIETYMGLFSEMEKKRKALAKETQVKGE